MKHSLITLILIIAAWNATAQSDSIMSRQEMKFTRSLTSRPAMLVDQQPEFPGGTDSLYSYLSRNIQYPLEAISKAIEGTVQIKFWVEADGSVTNPEIVKEIGGNCGQEVIRVFSEMPKWRPAMKKGKISRSMVVVPVSFQLPESSTTIDTVR